MTSLERAWRGGVAEWRLHALSVFSVGVAFVCLGAALLLVVNVEAVRERWSSIGNVSVFLRDGAEASQIGAIEQALRKTPGVASVRHVTSEQARSDILSGFSSDTLSALPTEAFPASLEVSLGDGHGSSVIKQMAAQLETLPAVEAVETYRTWGERLGSLLAGGVALSGLLALVVLASVASVVSSTIRLSLQRRRREVEILKLVGATDSYVRRPFLIEGAAQGALGAFTAVALLGFLYALISSQLGHVFSLLLGQDPSFLPAPVLLALVIGGAGLGALSASVSLRKFLIV